MTGKQALLDYGFVSGKDGSITYYKGGPSIKWVETPEGFLRWDYHNGQWEPVPHSIKPEYANRSGMHPRANPEAYDYAWNEEEIIKIYTASQS